MEIDRSNYEIWIIDWLDGNLNSSQVGQLNLFLDQNQDLREEFNELVPVKPLSSDISFPDKEKLKKSPSDISKAQFEYLCAAYLENDLTPGQMKEIEEIISTDPDKKKTFELIQRTILVPYRISYKHKNLLLKQTTIQKVIWLSVKGLSMAAAISLIIIIYSIMPRTPSPTINNTAHSLVSDSMLQRSSSDKGTVRKIKEIKTAPPEKKKENKASIQQTTKIAVSDDSYIKKSDNNEVPIEKIQVRSKVDLKKVIVSNTLVPSLPISSDTDERSHAGRFISKAFREKILRVKTPADTPLKGYEIAEAGVSGLNKLLGWQMALEMKKDEKGEPTAVSFSSGILKIQAPVKNREPQP